MEKNQKTAVIIGASGNLGAALCKKLEDRDYFIDPFWRRGSHPDATKIDSYSKLPKKIDLAVYLAGVNAVKSIEDLSKEEWDRVIDVNLNGAFLFAKSALPGLKKSRSGLFVVISSIMATHPYPNRIAYAASKAALEGLTRALAVEWGKYNIATHCIRLGHLSALMKSTPPNPQFLEAVKSKTPNGKLISPEDVASYILWLAEGGAPAVSGAVIDFDPAYTINRWPL